MHPPNLRLKLFPFLESDPLSLSCACVILCPFSNGGKMKVSLVYTSKAGVFLVIFLAGIGLSAQQSPPGQGVTIAPAASWHILVDEAEKNNPEILAAGHGWKAT